MLKFRTYEQNRPASSLTLRNAHMLGADGNAMRAEVFVEDGIIVCDRRETGNAALALQHRIGDLGEFTLRTCLLPEREQPYLLNVELARHRMLLLLSKQEDWAIYELEKDHPATKRIEAAKRLFTEALSRQREDPDKAEQLAMDCLIAAIDGSEELALAHSEILLNRRKTNQTLPRHPIGGGVALEPAHERLRAGLAGNFDYVQLPTPWRMLVPEERDFDFTRMDAWVDWASRAKIPIIAGPLICFDTYSLPDWIFIWEHDYDTIRDLIYEFVQKIVGRYGNYVSVWNVTAGLHVNNHFSLNLDQIMDLTRMTVTQVKKLRPNARALIELREPFGEYYFNNPRTIPPLTYADLIADSSLNFDGFSVRFLMGQAISGEYTRDLMQISAMLDEFSGFSKPVYLSMAVPSEPVTSMMIARSDMDEPVDDDCGFWRRPWSPTVQSHWLAAIGQIAMSKPFVEGVAWNEICDHQDMQLPLGGLVTESLQPKQAFKRLLHFRKQLSEQAGSFTAKVATHSPADVQAQMMPPSHESSADDPRGANE